MRKIVCDCGVVSRVGPAANEFRCPACDALLVYEGVTDAHDGETTPPGSTPHAKGAGSSVFVGRSRKNKRSRKTAVKRPVGDSIDKLEQLWTPGRRRWLDPAALLWMPILVPALAVALGTIYLGIRLLSFGILGMPAIVFGGFLGLVPTTFLIGHFSEILLEWANGGDQDPEWPTVDSYGMVRRLFQWLIAGACGGGIAFGLYRLCLHQWSDAPLWVQRVLHFGSVCAGVEYSCVVLLAVVTLDSIVNANPLTVIMAWCRMSKGRLSFWLEILVHVAVYMALIEWMRFMWRKSFIYGMPIWFLLIAVMFLGVPRLLRSLGMHYHRNRQRVQWFR